MVFGLRPLVVLTLLLPHLRALSPAPDSRRALWYGMQVGTLILPCHARVADAWSFPAPDNERGTSDRFDPLSSGAPVGRRLASSCDGCDHDESCACDKNWFFSCGCDESSCDQACNSGCLGCAAGKKWEYIGGECNSDSHNSKCEECSSCSSGRYRAPCIGDRCGKGSYYSGETSEACGSCTWCEGCNDGTVGPRKRVGCGGGTGGTGAGTCDTEDSNCPQCSSGRYAASSVQSCPCYSCPNCGPGKYRDKCGTEANNRGDTGTCEPCPDGKYKSGWSNENSCPDTFPRCGPGEYLVGYSASSSGTCTSCPEGKFKTSSSHPYDEQCEDCAPVNQGYYRDGCGGSSAGEAKPCPPNEYQPGYGYYTACTPCAPCAEGQYRDGCGPVNGGTCTPCPLRYLASSVTPDDAGAHCCVDQLDYLQDASCTPARHAALLVHDCTGLVMPPPQPPPPPPPPSPSPPPPSPCIDTDYGATDSYNDGCMTIGSNAGYDAYPQWCHRYDDNDFTSGAMCCACGGGILVWGRRLEVGDDDDSGGGASRALSSSPTSCKVGCQAVSHCRMQRATEPAAGAWMAHWPCRRATRPTTYPVARRARRCR